MKKRILAVALMLVLCVGLLAGCKEGWTEPVEEEDDGTIELSGEMYSGKVVVSLVLHPDGKAECDANGKKTEGTWKQGDDENMMIVDIEVADNPVQIEVTKAEDGTCSAPFPLVEGLVLTGK